MKNRATCPHGEESHEVRDSLVLLAAALAVGLLAVGCGGDGGRWSGGGQSSAGSVKTGGILADRVDQLHRLVQPA